MKRTLSVVAICLALTASSALADSATLPLDNKLPTVPVKISLGSYYHDLFGYGLKITSPHLTDKKLWSENKSPLQIPRAWFSQTFSFVVGGKYHFDNNFNSKISFSQAKLENGLSSFTPIQFLQQHASPYVASFDVLF